MSSLNQIAVVNRTKLTETKLTDRFYTSNLLTEPEFVIHHDTKRLAEQPTPWWYRKETKDDQS